MSNMDSITIVNNKRQRESIPEDDKSSGGRRSKVGKDNRDYKYIEYKENNSEEDSNSGSITQISDFNQSINNFSQIYDSFSKNDVLNLIWKLTITKEEFLNVAKKNFTQSYVSARKDVWKFSLESFSSGKNSGGFILTLGCEKLEPKNKNDSHNAENKTYLDKVFDSINFDIDINFQLINCKTQNFNFKGMNYDELDSKEIVIPNEFYANGGNPIINTSTRANKDKENKQDDNNIIVIIEMSIHKNFQTVISGDTSYTGIINEAATCYMNSMLQTLNVFGCFKRAVFQIPTNEDDYNSVSLSLQRLFFDLMRDTSPISTNRLVKSFGWGREQIHIQHDVQEFNLLLSDVIEKKMKGTPGEGTFAKLFEGKLINYIQCVHVNYKSEKEEKFSDLQLTVKGFKNIYESLNSYTEEEVLDNADKYEAEGYGKQKARKGIKFIKFPSVLILQLKRFEYNPKREAMVKINDYFEFYEEIDLTKYKDNNYDKDLEAFNLFSKGSDKSEDERYTLHSVVVHQGNANSGHYYAYIRPGMKDNWVQFNDEIVRPADKYEVFNNNYGGTYRTYKHKSKGEINSSINHFESNAYILVYIKNSEREHILSPVSINEISPYLVKRFEIEKAEERKIQMKKLRMVDNMNIILFSKENVYESANNCGMLGIINSYADLNIDAPLVLHKTQRMLINFPKHLTVQDFLLFIHSETNIPLDFMKLYVYESGCTAAELFLKQRSNYHLNLISVEDMSKYLSDFTNGNKNHLVSFFLYIDDPRYKVFSHLQYNTKEEYKIDEKMVFISKDLNKLTFHKNEDYEEKKEINIFNNETKVVFLKEWISNANCFKITKVISLNVESFSNYYNLEQYLNSAILHNTGRSNLRNASSDANSLNDLNDDKVFYVLERTSLKGTDDDIYSYDDNGIGLVNDSANGNIVLNQNNYLSIFKCVSSLILIPIFERQKSLILEQLEEMYNTIYVDVFCDEKEVYIIKKLKINMHDLIEENQLKKMILDEIMNGKLYNQIIDTKDHYLIDTNRNLSKIDEEFLTKALTIDHIEIQTERDRGPKFALACKENFILKYLDQAECRLDFNMNIFPKQALSEAYFQEIILYDSDNNRLCQLSLILPKKVKKCREIIDYLYDLVLYNSEIYKGENFLPEDYFFILQHPKKHYIYQMLIDNNYDLLKYESKADFIEYRLQPFKEQDIDCFQNTDYFKIFVAFQYVSSTHLKIEPIVIYLDKSLKLFELKFYIADKLNKMKSTKEINFDECLIKYYTAKIFDLKVHKDVNLQQYKEEETLETVFKDTRVYNVLIEIIKNIK